MDPTFGPIVALVSGSSLTRERWNQT